MLSSKRSEKKCKRFFYKCSKAEILMQGTVNAVTVPSAFVTILRYQWRMYADCTSAYSSNYLIMQIQVKSWLLFLSTEVENDVVCRCHSPSALRQKKQTHCFSGIWKCPSLLYTQRQWRYEKPRGIDLLQGK